jgi:rubrerythrin
VKHVDTGHSVGLEVFDNKLRVLAWEDEREQPVVNHQLPCKFSKVRFDALEKRALAVRLLLTDHRHEADEEPGETKFELTALNDDIGREPAVHEWCLDLDAVEESIAGVEKMGSEEWKRSRLPVDHVELKWRNHYKCPKCSHEWTDEWDSQCDDDCPNCGERHISPTDSEDIVARYRLCKHCDHFADEEGHLEDGEQEFDHDPEPDGPALTLDEWKAKRPDLFVNHPDGKIGPNSIHHSRRGKIDE